MELADNPILDQWEPRPFAVVDEQYGIETDMANCFATFYGLMDTPGINLEMMYDHPNGNGTLHLFVSAHIDTAEWKNIERFGGTFRNCQEPEVETYVTPSGLQVLITSARLLDNNDDIICYASFQMHGASFGLSASQYRSTDQVVPLVKEILDAFS